jgi:hypothetical protein
MIPMIIAEKPKPLFIGITQILPLEADARQPFFRA